MDEETEWDVDLAGVGTVTTWDRDLAGAGTRTVWDPMGAAMGEFPMVQWLMTVRDVRWIR